MPVILIAGISSTKKLHYASGVIGNSTGCNCHGAPIGTVTLQGLDSITVLANTNYPISLTYNQGLTSSYWGLDIKCSAGTFSTPGSWMKLSGNKEITHTAPLYSTIPSASYTFRGIKWNSGNLAPGTVVNFTFATVGGSSAGTANGRPSAGTFTIVVGASSLQCTSGNTTYSKNSTNVCSSNLPYQWNGYTCTTTGTYVKTFSGANSQGCDSIAALDLKVNPLPVVDPIIGPNSFCLNSITCFSDSIKGGIWSTLGNAILFNGGGCLTTVNSGNIQILYTIKDSNGCENTTSKWVSIIDPLDKLAKAFTTTPIVNISDSILLSNLSPVNGASYNWNGPNNFSSSLQNPVIRNASLLSSGYYVVTVTNNTPGCSSVTFDSVKVQVNNFYTISGRVVSPKGYPVNNAIIEMYWSNSINTMSDLIGYYQTFGNVNSNPTITPTKNNDINKTNGVTTLDLALTQSHILGKNKLNNPYKIIAADVNGDGKITTLDLVYMKRLILGIDTTFTNSTSKENRLWAFVDSSYQFPDTTNPFPFKDSISYIGLSANKTNQTFIGVKLGDVNWDWNPALARTPSKVFVRPKKMRVGE